MDAEVDGSAVEVILVVWGFSGSEVTVTTVEVGSVDFLVDVPVQRSYYYTLGKANTQVFAFRHTSFNNNVTDNP